MFNKLLNKIFIIFLTLVSLVLVLNLLGLVKLLVVKTGSMTPTLPVNSLILVSPQKNLLQKNINQNLAKYKISQIISFVAPSSKSLITHRIVAVVERNNQIFYQTKGDANKSRDIWLTPQKNVAGNLLFSLPWLGIIATFLNSFAGIFVLVIIPSTFVILHEVLVIEEELKKSEGLKISKKTIAGPILVILILVLATPVYAIFNSQVLVTSNSLSTKDSFLTVPPECSGIVFSGPQIMGTEDNDVLKGTSGNDLIFGLGGNDKIDGGSGDDCLVGGDGNDQINGGSGNDVILGEVGEDILWGGSGTDKIYGGDGNDQLFSGSGADNAKGDRGNDYINGGSGSDSLDGGSGVDTLNGEAGRDTCINGEIIRNCEVP